MSAGLWFVVVFSLVIGTAIPTFWVTAIATGKVPEIAEGKKEIWFHIAAEIATGAVLVAAGIVTWATGARGWTAPVSFLGLGALLYTATVSPGYYVDRGDRSMTAMFAIVWIGALTAVIMRLAA